MPSEVNAPAPSPTPPPFLIPELNIHFPFIPFPLDSRLWTLDS